MSPDHETIALSGATGLIGSRLLRLLACNGYKVRALSRQPQQDSPGIVHICGDIRSAEAARDLTQGCSALIHLAGIAHTSLRTQAQRDEAESINVGGARNLLAAARNAGVRRVLLASSAHVYAGQQGTNLDEQSATAADSFYARTKLMVEQAGLETASSGSLQVVIVRPCLTYGAGVRFNLASLMRAIRGRYYFQIRGANPMRSFLSVANAAAGIMHVLESGESCKIYNLADQEPLSLAEFANSLADLLQVSRPWQVPMFAVGAAIAGATPLQWMGLHSPVNRESLRKLTVSFTLDVSRLAATGFRWPDNGIATRMSMVEAFLGPQHGSQHGPHQDPQKDPHKEC